MALAASVCADLFGCQRYWALRVVHATSSMWVLVTEWPHGGMLPPVPIADLIKWPTVAMLVVVATVFARVDDYMDVWTVAQNIMSSLQLGKLGLQPNILDPASANSACRITRSTAMPQYCATYQARHKERLPISSYSTSIYTKQLFALCQHRNSLTQQQDPFMYRSTHTYHISCSDVQTVNKTGC